MSRALIMGLGLLVVAEAAPGGEVRVAVAANFAPCLEELAAAFTATTGDRGVIGTTPRSVSG